MTRDGKARGIQEAQIWIVAPVPPPYGGMSLQALKLAQKLAAEGYTVALLPTNPSPPRGLQFLARVPAVRTLMREIQYLYSLRVTLQKNSIIHHLSASDLFFFLHSVPLVFCARLSKAKFVLNYRGGKADRFLKAWSWVVVPLLRSVGEVAVPSEYLQRVFGRYGLRCSILPNIADTDLFPFKERTQLSPSFFVSRHLEPMYDIECVLRAFARVQQTFPDAVLGIAGDGSETARLQASVREWGLRGVTFYGAVDYSQLPALYAQHDIYINGSRVDNFPGALVEAASAGLPIVTTRAGGIPEMIEHRKNGLLADVGDHQALAANALELLRSPEVAQEMARRARTWAEQFSWARILPRLLLAYGISRENDGQQSRATEVLLQGAHQE